MLEGFKVEGLGFWGTGSGVKGSGRLGLNSFWVLAGAQSNFDLEYMPNHGWLKNTVVIFACMPTSLQYIIYPESPFLTLEAPIQLGTPLPIFGYWHHQPHHHINIHHPNLRTQS